MTTQQTEIPRQSEIARKAEIARARQEIETLSAESYDGTQDAAPAGSPTECDVIMKGGIASGVVYPLTICKLATRYRLRSIGGTSAGAIAAVMAAAAEYRRTHDDDEPAAGFRALARLPEDISARLESLFQAPAPTRPFFELALVAMGEGRALRLPVAIVRLKPVWFAAGLLLVLLLAVPGALVAAEGSLAGSRWLWLLLGPVLLGVVVGVVTALVGLVRALVTVLPQHDFGVTDGGTHSDDPATPGLTAWLTDQIDEVAGVTGPDRCLTLGDLWGEDGLTAWQEHLGGADRTPAGSVRRRRTVELETMTTNLTLRRPFRLPFRQQDFLFDADELRHLFPERVVSTMVAGLAPSVHLNPRTRAPLHYFPGPGREVEGDARPGPQHLPVVVMARMSLSFPGLISAVPLYAVDHNNDQQVVRHLFSDGGISSNFPMHFFDSLLPSRPTFGINLATPHPAHPDQMTWLPPAGKGGVLPRATAFTTVLGFAQALRDSVQNWSDNTQVTQRGYAERVVEIRLGSGEGGMNLRMPEDLIMALVARGAEAGDKLLLDFEWDVHRVIRYRVAMARLTESLETLDRTWNDVDYASLLTQFPSTGTASTFVKGQSWREKDLAATQQLLDAVDHWRHEDWPALLRDRPSPAPAIRLAPE